MHLCRHTCADRIDGSEHPSSDLAQFRLREHSTALQDHLHDAVTVVFDITVVLDIMIIYDIW